MAPAGAGARETSFDERMTDPHAGRRMMDASTIIDPPPASAQPVMAAGAGTPVGAATIPATTLAGAKTQIWISTHRRPADLDPRLILLREPDSPRAASFRVLRHRLGELGEPRTLAVTSPEAREGKTLCAANLALALSECGRARVLLVEANLRTPALAALFGFMPPECFGEQLVRHRERPLEPWSVVEVYSPWLHVAAVRPNAPGRPLLDGPAFAIAMERLKQAGYDYIVLDTPPVVGSADVNLIVDAADGVIVTVWARKTAGRALRRAHDQLSPAKILGLVLIDA